MLLPDIREAIVAVLADVPEIGSVLPYPSANVGALPHVQLGFIAGRIELGMSTQQEFHEIPCTVLLAMRGEYEQEIRAVEAFLPDFVGLMHTNLSLGLTYVDRAQVTRYVEGIYRLGGVEYIGFIATIEVKERHHVALGG